MSLEKLNLVELNAQEIVEVDGGNNKPLGFWDYVRAYHIANVTIWNIGLDLLGELAIAYGQYVTAYPNRNL
jgi:hypothetical protein